VIDELRALARAVALDVQLDVVEGTRGGGWSLQPHTRRILADPRDLEEEHPDDVRGLVCHEAAHAAVTRYPWLVPATTLASPGMPVLLNALEDCRIEAWLAARYPGARAWIERYNQRLFPPGSSALAGRSRIHQYALASVHQWWHGRLPRGLREEVVEALDATQSARDEVVRAQPPTSPEVGLVGEYASSPAAACFAHADARVPPDALERAVRIAAWQAWEIVYTAILPVVRPLVSRDLAEHKRLEEEEEELLRQLSGRPAAAPLRPARRPSAVGQGGAGASGQRSVGLPELDTAERAQVEGVVFAPAADRYEQARRDVVRLVRPLTDELLASLRLDAYPRWTTGHRCGARVNLSAAMQAAADPRRRGEVWQRKTLPRDHDPCFFFLVDLSGSMEGRSISTAVRGTVLCCEVLSLLRVPFAVAGFQDQLIWIKRFVDELDDRCRRRVASMEDEVRGRRPGGRNRPEHNWDGPALRAAASALIDRRERQRVLVVVSDGRPSGPHDGETVLRRAVADITADRRVQLIGLGLGPGTYHVARYYPHHAAAVPLDAFPATMGQILRARLRDP